MGYKDCMKREAKKEFRGLSALDAYYIGRELYMEEVRRRQEIVKYASNITQIGSMLIQRFLDGKPERRLP